MRKGIIDRFEGEFAVVEFEGAMETIKLSDIPNDAREGDVIVFENNRWTIDREDTKRLKNETQKLADELWE